MSTAKLAGDRYLNGFLNAVVEITVYTSSFFILNRYDHVAVFESVIVGIGKSNIIIFVPQVKYYISQNLDDRIEWLENKLLVAYFSTSPLLPSSLQIKVADAGSSQ